MPDLIPFVTRQLGNESVNTVNARDLHTYLGITQRYADWIKVQIRRAHLIEHTDYIVFHLEGNNPQGGRPQVDHHLTFDAAKHVAMMSSADKGHEVRAWFIAKEKELAAVQTQTPAVLNPEHQMMIDMIVRIDQNEQRSIAAERHAAQAQLDAAHASANALRAMECQSFFTIAEYVYIHKLQRQLPPSAYKAASDHLRAYSLDNKTPPPRKVQVWDRTWKDEWSFHITIFVEAFDPWLLRRGAQTNLRVLPDPYEGNN